MPFTLSKFRIPKKFIAFRFDDSNHHQKTMSENSRDSIFANVAFLWPRFLFLFVVIIFNMMKTKMHIIYNDLIWIHLCAVCIRPLRHSNKTFTEGKHIFSARIQFAFMLCSRSSFRSFHEHTMNKRMWCVHDASCIYDKCMRKRLYSDDEW